MNKKVVFGCLGSVVVLGIVVSVLLYVFLLRPLLEISGDIRDVAKIPEMNAEILNRDPFTPPEDGVLTESQIDRFARVQTAMRNDLGPVYEELRKRSATVRSLLADMDDEKASDVSFREALDMLRGLGKVLPEAKRAQIRALNQEGFSHAEYRWVRESFYYALDEESAGIYVEDLASEVMEKKESFDPDRIPRPEVGPVPEANARTAAAFADSLDSWRPFLVFGL